MSDTTHRYETVVVGAGVIGCAVARTLAADRDVLVLDEGQVAGATTAKASGLITIVPDLPNHPQAARHSIDFFRAYDGTGNFSFTPRPAVGLVEADGEADAREHAAEIAADGFDVSYLTADDLAERFPDVFSLDDFDGGVVYEDAGWVDPYTYAMTLKEDAEDRGAVFETGTAVDGIVGDGDEVAGVRVGDELIRADRVVVAAGWRTRDLVAEFVEVPLRPFRWQTVNLELSRDLGADYPIAFEPLTGLYWRPEHNGDLHVGGGTYFVDDPGDVRSTITDGFRNLVAGRIPRYLSGLGEARFVGEDCCPTGDAATPDNLPVVDAPHEAPDGLILATSCPVGGIMTSPIVAAAVRSLATGEDAPFSLAPYALDRFEDRSPDFSCRYVEEHATGDEM